MTAMRWADARVGIKHTGMGWNRHDCRRVWFVATVHPEGALIFLTPPGEPNWEEIENPILAFDRASEASAVAAHQEGRLTWYPINLSDLLWFEGNERGKPRFRMSEPFLRAVAETWARKR